MSGDATAGRRWLRLLAVAACGAAVAVGPTGVAEAAPAPAVQPPVRPPVSRAAPEAAPPADAARRAIVTWQTHGRPAALVVVRRTGIDLVDRGRLTRRVPRVGSELSLSALGSYLPRTWLAVTGGTARLSAAVVLTPGVTLDVGAPVTTLQLAGGATSREAASLFTGSGRLALHGVTVVSADRDAGQPMEPALGRPFVLVGPGGRLTATDSTFRGLGSAPGDSARSTDPAAQDHPGVDFHSGSTGSLVRTSLVRNGIGLKLDRSQGVRLEDVTVSEASGDGLVLRGDRGTTLTRVRAERNGAYGVHVAGPSSDRPITGIVSAGNGTFGLGVDKQTGTTITGVTTSGNGSGGVDVSQSKDVTFTDLSVVDEPMGVFSHINNANVVFDRLSSTRGRRGVIVEKTTSHLTLQNSTITGAAVAGVASGGKDVQLRNVSVAGSRTGLRVERGASGLTATAVAVSGGLDGVVASAGTAGVVLQDLSVEGVATDAVRSSSPDARIVGGRITGGSTGIVVDAATTISGTSIGMVDQGIRTQSPGLVHADDIEVNALSVGINAADGSPFLLTGSRVHALEAVRGTLDDPGTNDLSLPPLNLLGAIGIPLIVVATALQAVAVLRGRRFGGDVRRKPPTVSARGRAAARISAQSGRTPTVPVPVQGAAVADDTRVPA